MTSTLNPIAQVLRNIKRSLVKPGVQPITMKFGLGKNMSMMIDPAHKTQRIYGLDEREIAAVVREYILKARTIVDVGTNDGYYTLIASVLNPQAKIFSCEPEAEMQPKCVQNLQLNGLNFSDRIQWVPKFIGDAPTPELAGESLALDQLLAGAEEPIFIKMDIDGGELIALKSGLETLTHKQCFLVVETHSPSLEVDCMNFLSSLGYKCRLIPNAWWRFFVPEYRPIEQNRWFSATK